MRVSCAAGVIGMFLLWGCASSESPPSEPIVTSAPIIEESAMASEFGLLAGLVGTRWYGEPGEAGKAQGQSADYSEWYWDLGGSVLVNRHVLADGSYGGVTYVQKNSVTDDLDYVYITSAGFRTSGRFTLNADGSWTAYETVAGLEDIIGVRSTGRITEDGALLSVSDFETADGWMPGHTFLYQKTGDPMPELAPSLEIE